jgi:hypothetical protein
MCNIEELVKEKHYLMITMRDGDNTPEEVERRTLDRVRQHGEIAFVYFSQNELVYGSDTLRGARRHFSPRYYWGTEVTLDEVILLEQKATPGSFERTMYGNIISNMKQERRDRAVMILDSSTPHILRDNEVALPITGAVK